MRLGIRAHDTKYAPLDELIPNIHSMGFKCMHIALTKSIKEFTPDICTRTPGACNAHERGFVLKIKLMLAVLGC